MSFGRKRPAPGEESKRQQKRRQIENPGANDKRKGNISYDPQGRLLWQDPANLQYIPAVYHNDIRQELLVRASNNGRYQYNVPRAKGRMLYDETAFHAQQRDWTGERQYWGQIRDDILNMLERQDYVGRYDKDPILTWYEGGRIVLDHDNHPLRIFPDLPLTLSSEIEGWYLEAVMRLDGRIQRTDIRARLPRKRKEASGKIKDVISLSGIGNKAMRFRGDEGLVAWQERKDNRRMNDFMRSRLPPASLQTNTTQGSRALSERERRQRDAISAGLSPTLADNETEVEETAMEQRNNAEEVAAADDQLTTLPPFPNFDHRRLGSEFTQAESSSQGQQQARLNTEYARGANGYYSYVPPARSSRPSYQNRSFASIPILHLETPTSGWHDLDRMETNTEPQALNDAINTSVVGQCHSDGEVHPQTADASPPSSDANPLPTEPANFQRELDILSPGYTNNILDPELFSGYAVQQSSGAVANHLGHEEAQSAENGTMLPTVQSKKRRNSELSNEGDEDLGLFPKRKRRETPNDNIDPAILQQANDKHHAVESLPRLQQNHGVAPAVERREIDTIYSIQSPLARVKRHNHETPQAQATTGFELSIPNFFSSSRYNGAYEGEVASPSDSYRYIAPETLAQVRTVQIILEYARQDYVRYLRGGLFSSLFGFDLPATDPNASYQSQYDQLNVAFIEAWQQDHPDEDIPPSLRTIRNWSNSWDEWELEPLELW